MNDIDWLWPRKSPRTTHEEIQMECTQWFHRHHSKRLILGKSTVDLVLWYWFWTILVYQRTVDVLQGYLPTLRGVVMRLRTLYAIVHGESCFGVTRTVTMTAQFIGPSCFPNYHKNEKLVEDDCPIGFYDDNTLSTTLLEGLEWSIQHSMAILQFLNGFFGTFVTPPSHTHICNMSVKVQFPCICAPTHVQWKDICNVPPKLILLSEFDGVFNKSEGHWRCCYSTKFFSVTLAVEPTNAQWLPNISPFWSQISNESFHTPCLSAPCVYIIYWNGHRFLGRFFLDMGVVVCQGNPIFIFICLRGLHVAASSTHQRQPTSMSFHHSSGPISLSVASGVPLAEGLVCIPQYLYHRISIY